MPILEKMDVAKYLIFNYRSKYDTDISPIKLQKGLYFLFAYWGGKIRAQHLSSDCDNSLGEDCITEMVESDILDSREYLFQPNFEAWAYGPVDREVYVWWKNLQLNERKLIEMPESVENLHFETRAYLDEFSDRIFNTSDFGLVDASHEDKAWREVYNPSSKNKIDSEEIIKEYATQQK